MMVDYGKLQLKISSVSQWKQLPMEPHVLRVRLCHDVESLLEEEIRGTSTSSM